MILSSAADVPFWWYLARSTGLVSTFAMGASIALGVFLSTRLLPDRRRPAWLLDAHRWLSGIAVVALIGHIGSLVADSYLTFGWREILVPQASAWEPIAVTFGVLALWSLAIGVAVVVFRRRLPRRLWTTLHRATYASFWLGLVHAGMAGTDASNRWYQAAAVVMVSSVSFLALYRVMVTEGPRRSRPVGGRLDRTGPVARG